MSPEADTWDMEIALGRIDWEKWTASLVLVPACAYFLLVDFGARSWAGAPWLLMHSMDLIVHEAGHFFFRFFGRTMMIAGGSLLQILLPALVAWSSLTWGSRIGVQLGLFWLGQSLVDVSVYAADAQMRRLPLLGGSADHHDWYNLLRQVDALRHAEAVGFAFVVAAVVVWAFALLLPRWMP